MRAPSHVVMATSLDCHAFTQGDSKPAAKGMGGPLNTSEAGSVEARCLVGTWRRSAGPAYFLLAPRFSPDSLCTRPRRASGFPALETWQQHRANKKGNSLGPMERAILTRHRTPVGISVKPGLAKQSMSFEHWHCIGPA